jgi:hypothetical protein
VTSTEGGTSPAAAIRAAASGALQEAADDSGRRDAVVTRQVIVGQTVLAPPGLPGSVDRGSRVDQRPVHVEDDGVERLIGQTTQTHNDS